MQMQIVSKNQIIENYAEEIEKLNNRIRQMGGGDGSNCKNSLTQSTSMQFTLTLRTSTTQSSI